MKDDSFSHTDIPDQVLDKIYIELLKKFRKYNSNGNKLFCSYMAAGQNYENELLVIGREPFYWREEFSTEELNEEGPEYIFKVKVFHPGIYGLDSLCPLSYVTDLWGNTKNRNCYNTLYNSFHDPFWGCIKDVVLKLGICKNGSNWPSSLALTYLYKIAFSSKSYLLEKPRKLQFELCKEMLQLELSILKPKRILFLTGMKYAQDFLNLPNNLEFNDCFYNLGDFDYGFHKARTVVSVNPKNCRREILVKEIIYAFKN